MKRQRGLKGVGSYHGDDGAPQRGDALHYACDLMVGFKYMKPDFPMPELDEDSTAQLRSVHDSCSEKVELQDA